MLLFLLKKNDILPFANRIYVLKLFFELRFKGYFRVGSISISGILLARKRANNVSYYSYLIFDFSFSKLSREVSKERALEVLDRVLVSSSFLVDLKAIKILYNWLEFFQDILFVRPFGILEKKYGMKRFSLVATLRGRKMFFFVEELLSLHLNIQKKIGGGFK